MSRLFASLIFSGSRFNFPIISDIGPTYIFYYVIKIVTKATISILLTSVLVWGSHVDDAYSITEPCLLLISLRHILENNV